MAAWLHQLLYANVMAGVLTALVCVLRRFGRRALGSRWLYAAWLLVALRLMLPVTVAVPVQLPGMLARPLGAVTADAPKASMEQASAAATSAGAKAAAWPPSAVPGAIWLAGVAIAGACMALRNARFRRSLSMRRPTDREGAAIAACMARHGLRLPRVYVSAHVSSPCLVGGPRARLVLPQGMPLSDAAAGFALLHEACHVRAGDPFWAWLRAALCCLHWFNPAVWIAARLSAIDAELACDMRVMARLDEKDRFPYARTLVAAAGHQALSMPGVCFAGGRLQARIAQILEVQKMKKAWMLAAAALMTIVLGASFAVSEATPTEAYDWWIPAGIREGATFYEPVREGSTEHRRIKVDEMDNASEDALIITKLTPTACNVVLNGIKGKMFREDLIIDPQTLAGETGYIFSPDSQGLAVYEEPDAESRAVMVLYGDYAVVEIDRYGEDWCRVKLGDNAGYVPTERVGAGYPDAGGDVGWFY